MSAVTSQPSVSTARNSLGRRSTRSCRSLGRIGWLSLGLIWVGACTGTSPTPPASDIASEPGPVTVVIEMGDQQVEKVFEAVRPGTTIAELMSGIEEPPVRITGSGKMAFVESIGELDTSQGLGWTFQVDGQWADRGIGAFTVQPPVEVRWTHGSFDRAARQ